MNLKFLLIPFAAASLASCSTAYKSGQTPDDVYYSPARQEVTTHRVEQNNDDDYYSTDYEDRNIRMAVRDYRWRSLDDMYDCNYAYNPYYYGYNYGYYYNPYYYNYPVYIPGYVIVNPKNTAPRTTNLGSYNNTATSTSSPKTGQTQWIQTRPVYNNSNSTYNRRVLTPTYSPGTRSSATPSSSTRRTGEENNTRTYSPSSSSGSSSGSSSSGSSSGSGSSVTRPGRGN